MTLAVSFNTYWGIALGIGLVAALVVALLLGVLIVAVRSIERRSTGCWRSRARSAPTRRTSRSSRRRHRSSRLIVDEAVVQDGYMNALTDGFGGR